MAGSESTSGQDELQSFIGSPQPHHNINSRHDSTSPDSSMSAFAAQELMRQRDLDREEKAKAETKKGHQGDRYRPYSSNSPKTGSTAEVLAGHSDAHAGLEDLYIAKPMKFNTDVWTTN